jgi:hypothetical protein
MTIEIDNVITDNEHPAYVMYVISFMFCDAIGIVGMLVMCFLDDISFVLFFTDDICCVLFFTDDICCVLFFTDDICSHRCT